LATTQGPMALSVTRLSILLVIVLSPLCFGTGPPLALLYQERLIADGRGL
jgi:hypothetical protein